MFKLILIIAITVSLGQGQRVQFQWNYLNFTWPSTSAYNSAVQSGTYIPVNNLITGIKVWKNLLYLTLPRWKNGVPATLTVTSATPIANDFSPLLEPYPNWGMQQLGNCLAFQLVQSMEIDSRGRMWVLDNGLTEFMTSKPRVKCPPRLVILDLERNGQVLLNYVFSDQEVRRDSAFLNDIVLDHEDGGWAYITDTDSKNPGIIVFSLRDKISWKVKHESMNPKAEASVFEVDGKRFRNSVPVDGIALSPASTAGNRILYYTPLTSYEIFAIPVQILKTRSIYNVDPYISVIGRKLSQTDGMMISATKNLYHGLLKENAVATWHLENSLLPENPEIIAQDRHVNQWPDTFAIDEFGQLWWTTNRIQNFMTNTVNISEFNYHVIVSDINARSYLCYEDGSCPDFPAINL